MSSAPASVSWSELYAPVANALEGAKQCLLDIVPPDSQLLALTLHHSLNSGGKYLRPVVTLLAGQATGTVGEALTEVSAVSEMIHIATLLHDDVLDNADLRRGKKTVRAQWGNTVSVLSGDYLLAQASMKLAAIGNIRLVSIYSKVLADLCDGEVEQIRTSYALDTPWDSYYRKTICKTASLFAAGCESAGVVNNLPEHQIQSLRTFGNNFGIAFQIVDDLLDYTSSEAEMGKPVLDDLRNGLLNAPILLALESDRLSGEENRELRQIIEDVFDATDPKVQVGMIRLKELLVQAGALEETLRMATNYVEDGIQSIDFIADSPAKRSLLGLISSILNRRS